MNKDASASQNDEAVPRSVRPLQPFLRIRETMNRMSRAVSMGDAQVPNPSLTVNPAYLSMSSTRSAFVPEVDTAKWSHRRVKFAKSGAVSKTSSAKPLQKTSTKKSQDPEPFDEDELQQMVDELTHDEETATPSTFNLPAFTPETFMIYGWPLPSYPKDMTKLPEDLKAWKANQDAQDADRDGILDDGADNWEEVSGIVEDYGDWSSFCGAIARVFVNRAKRAFRSGRPWNAFVLEEHLVDPAKATFAEKRREKREKVLEEGLDNELRLAVFNAIARRLCNEIWLEQYPGPPSEKIEQRHDCNGIPSSEMSTEDLKADLARLHQIQRQNEMRPMGGFEGMTAMEAMLRQQDIFNPPFEDGGE